jgi:hypothetical protein
VFPVSDSTDTDVRTGGSGGSVTQSILTWENRLADHKEASIIIMAK